MIKNAKLLAVSTAVSVLALTACGGGGGGDGTSDSGVSVNQSVKVGGGLVNVKDNKEGTAKYQQSTDMDILVVDGRKLNIPLGVVEGRSLLSDNGDHKLNTSWGEYAYAGISFNPDYKDKNGKKNDIYLYYQGELTPENSMPKAGKITYQGGRAFDKTNWNVAGAFLIDTNEIGDNVANYSTTHRATYHASVELTADFDNKKLSGRVFELANPVNGALLNKTGSGKTFTEIPINADIKGNTFSGTEKNVTTEGKFFGPNANTVAGTFNDKSQKIQGSFAADKVK